MSLKPLFVSLFALGSMTVVTPALAAPQSRALAALIAQERAVMLREDPVTATYEGVHEGDNRLPSVTPADQERRLKADTAFLAQLERISPSKLTPGEAVSRDLLVFIIRQRVTLARYREWRIPITSDSGFYADLVLLADAHRFKTVADYEAYIARLNDIPRYFGENIANMRMGLAEGFTLPAQILPGIGGVVNGAQIDKVEDATFWSPFTRFPDTISQTDRDRLMAAGRAAIGGPVKTAYADFKTFFDTDYAKGARSTIGASSLPDGTTYYTDLARYFTTLPDATPERIHQTGVTEVARIRAQMLAVMAETGFKGDLPAFFTFLRTDPQFYATNGDQLLREAAWITREVDAQMPRFFGRIPRTPYTVKPVPAALAPNYTTGRYSSGSIGSAGEYWVNTTKLDQRPLYVLPALTLHEAAPGHHTQTALAREMGTLPDFRRNFYSHAFGEGWGLYAEFLGQEMGVYNTPYEKFGRLTYEMWRACRLVVDTGMHAKGWSRQQALDYMTANTSLSPHEIRTEIDRYIAWPGQALAYKVGEMKIIALRRGAEAELGSRFDLRAFHDAVLANGGVTLPILDAKVRDYVTAAKK